MIKKQYYRITPGYFKNFIDSNDPEGIIEEGLEPYKATIGKSKNKNHKLNVKWHDEKLYTLFVLRYS
jgi:hypothetical protein